jgi:protein-S-isoprenylcysteine O-methyltransferase Ste14
MFRAYYEIAFLVGLVLIYAIRRYYGLIFRARGVKEQAYNTRLDRAMAGLAELGLIAGATYLLTDWLDFANYPPLTWLSWSGVPILGFGLWLIWQAHKDLDRSWSPHVEILRAQKLISEGVYRRIRHPMYAGYLLFGIGQLMILANWVAGPAFLGLFGLLYLQRVTREEKMMLAKFGEEYQRYIQNTGRLLPKFNQLENREQKTFINQTKK